MEMADALVITKADSDNKKKATQAAADYQHALHLFQAPASGWTTKVLTCSALENQGIDQVWESIIQYQNFTQARGFWESNRRQQNKTWLYECFNNLLQQEVNKSQSFNNGVSALEQKVENGSLSPYQGAKDLLSMFKKSSL